MIDLHSHVLAGVDDGPTDIEESVEMLRIAAKDGTRVIVATPHAWGPDHDTAREAAKTAHAALVLAAKEADIEIEIRLAAETWFRPDLPRLAREGRLATLCEGGARYALIEFPMSHVPLDAEDVLFQVRLEGLTPVIAHPERNPSFWSAPERAVRMREQGAVLQVTAASLTGLFRAESKDAAKALAKAGAIDCLASDAHGRTRRPPGLSEAKRVLAKWMGEAAAERATVSVPAAILAGAPLPAAV